MGLFDKVRKGFSEMTGGVDGELFQIGQPGRAVIVNVQMSGTTVQMGGGLVERVCTFVVEVTLNDVPPYQAQVRQRVPEMWLAQIQPGATVVTARVHPQDRMRVALDFNAPPPTVRLAANGDPTGSAAWLLANGTPARAVIVQNQPLGMTNPDGVPMHAFVLTISPQDGMPYQIQVGNPVPPEALPLLYPGSKVPVKVAPGNPNAAVIDWVAALGD
jgi:hypothetical protein